MKIGLFDSEMKSGYPNLALMKISAFHKSKGDIIQWFSPLEKYDKVFSSKVFTWTKSNNKLPKNTIKGGTGYNSNEWLSDEIEHICPDYSLYNCKQSYGFLTRGCPNKCSWCVVPEKEGYIKKHADIDEFARHQNVVLMDNNVLASEFGISQIEKIIKLKLKVDFNQGLDSRLIDKNIAKLLSKVNWLSPIRLACDTVSQIPHIINAVSLLRWNNATPRKYFCYVLVKDISDAIERIRLLKSLYLDPFAQPYRDKNGRLKPSKEQLDFCRWVNHKAIFNSVLWEDYKKNIKKVEKPENKLGINI
jgi:hypothetical protein